MDIWENDVLGLKNKDKRSERSCAATTQYGDRCRNIISFDNRDEAEKICGFLSTRAFDGPELHYWLEELADCMLCKRVHCEERDSSQKYHCVQDWTEKMEKYMDRWHIEAPRPVLQIAYHSPSAPSLAAVQAESSGLVQASSPIPKREDATSQAATGGGGGHLAVANIAQTISFDASAGSSDMLQASRTTTPSLLDREAQTVTSPTLDALNRAVHAAGTQAGDSIERDSAILASEDAGSSTQSDLGDHAAHPTEHGVVLQHIHEHEVKSSQDCSQDTVAQQASEASTKHQIEQVKFNGEVIQFLQALHDKHDRMAAPCEVSIEKIYQSLHDLHAKVDRVAASREASTERQIEQGKSIEDIRQSLHNLHDKFDRHAASQEALQLELETLTGLIQRMFEDKSFHLAAEAVKYSATEGSAASEAGEASVAEVTLKSDQASDDIDELREDTVDTKRNASSAVRLVQEWFDNFTVSSRRSKSSSTRTSTGSGDASTIRESRSPVPSKRSAARSKAHAASSQRGQSKRFSISGIKQTLFKKR